jgi:hypothetical protein
MTSFACTQADAQHLESVVASLEEEVLKLPPLQAALAAAQVSQAQLQTVLARHQPHAGSLSGPFCRYHQRLPACEACCCVATACPHVRGDP